MFWQSLMAVPALTLTMSAHAQTAIKKRGDKALSNSYSISQKGLDAIKTFEGLRLDAYLCPAGVWTIGYGTTRGVMKGDRITKEQAEKLLIEDVRQFEAAINKLVKVALKQGQFDALVVFCYNVGVGAFERSTLLSVLNMGRYADVPAQLMRWTKVKGKELSGLVNRRNAEVLLWNS